MYKDFAYIYDELMYDVDYKKWFEYIEDIVKKEGVQVEDVLEMACGTGRMSYYLLKEGYRLTCFDISEDMLSVAENRLREFKNKNILSHDMVEFSNPNSYDLIVSNCDSINYLIEDGDLKETFIKVKENLREDGLFIFDINSSYKLKNVLGNNVFIEDREDVFYTWENFLYEDENLVEFYLKFFVKDGDRYTRFDEEHVERIYEVDEIISILKDIGFNNIKVYESFTFEEKMEKTERITFVVQP